MSANFSTLAIKAPSARTLRLDWIMNHPMRKCEKHVDSQTPWSSSAHYLKGLKHLVGQRVDSLVAVRSSVLLSLEHSFESHGCFFSTRQQAPWIRKASESFREL